MTVDELITEIMKAEGWDTVTNDSFDRGGLTKFGITIATLSDWLGGTATPDMLRNLSEADARAIYREKYIEAPGFAQIADPRLQLMAVDAGVLHGPTRAIRWLQEALGAKTDGVLGPATAAALDVADPAAVTMRFLAIRCRAIALLVSRDSSQVKWLNGWMRRATRFVLET